EKFEFNSLMERVGYEKVNETDLVEEVNYTIVTDETKEQYESLLTDGGCLHVELDGENYHRSTIISFGLDHHDTVLYIPLDIAKRWPAFQNWLESDNDKIIHDLKRAKVALAWHD